MKGLTYNPETHEYTLFTFDKNDSLQSLQQQVDGFVECVSADEFNEHSIDIWVNEEGMVNGLAHAAIVTVNGYSMPLFGNLAFARCDEEGYTVGLSDDDIAYIKGTLHTI